MRQVARVAVTGSVFLCGAIRATGANGQTAGTTSPARASGSSPTVSYTVRVEATDTTQLFVEMRVANAPPAFRVARPAQPEYNERFFRHVRNVSTSAGLSVAREDSTLWRVTAKNGSATLFYSIELPTRELAIRGSWRMFLTPRGGLVGGYDTFVSVSCRGCEGASPGGC